MTTDFRSAIAAILARHLRLGDAQLATVLPSAPPIDPDLHKLLPA